MRASRENRCWTILPDGTHLSVDTGGRRGGGGGERGEESIGVEGSERRGRMRMGLWIRATHQKGL